MQICIPKTLLRTFFVALFVLSFCPFDISVGVGAFVIGLSQISSFFSSVDHSNFFFFHIN